MTIKFYKNLKCITFFFVLPFHSHSNIFFKREWWYTMKKRQEQLSCSCYCHVFDLLLHSNIKVMNWVVEVRHNNDKDNSFCFYCFWFSNSLFFWNNRSSKHDICTHTDIFVFFCIKPDVLHGVLFLHLLKFFDCGLFSIEWMNLYKLNLKKKYLLFF